MWQKKLKIIVGRNIEFGMVTESYTSVQFLYENYFVY
jgi:hypothetical protein